MTSLLFLGTPFKCVHEIATVQVHTWMLTHACAHNPYIPNTLHTHTARHRCLPLFCQCNSSTTNNNSTTTVAATTGCNRVMQRSWAHRHSLNLPSAHITQNMIKPSARIAHRHTHKRAHAQTHRFVQPSLPPHRALLLAGAHNVLQRRAVGRLHQRIGSGAAGTQGRMVWWGWAAQVKLDGSAGRAPAHA